MKTTTQNFLKWSATAAGMTGVTAMSAYVMTSYLVKMAMDREEPKLMKAIERKVAGEVSENGFYQAVKQGAIHLAKKKNETIMITGYDGEKLVAHWIPCPDAKRIIIAVHGWRSSWSQAFGMVSDVWEKHDCSVLYIEQRGQNSSGGDAMGFGLTERYDCLDWIHWINENCGSELPVYLCGISMGASTVLMTADLDLPANVHGIIADCGYTSPHEIWKHVANKNLHITFGVKGVIADELLKQKIGMDPEDFSTIDILQKTKIPVMLIHGSNDHFVPVEMTYRNYMACGGPKRLLIVPGADHAMSYYTEPERYEAAIVDFWKEFDGMSGVEKQCL